MPRGNSKNCDIKDKIKQVFKNFSNKASIGTTGASKALHVLYPDLFMPWDTNIRKKYHTFHERKSNFKQHKKNSPECYLEYMKNCRQIVRVLRRHKSKNIIWQRHLNKIDMKTKSLLKKFKYKETLLKIIDEYNYIKFTKNKKPNS